MKDKLEPNISLEFNPLFRDAKVNRPLMQRIKARIASISKLIKRNKDV